ncbi:hypothetical protein BGX20_009985 [Mortierella sp. AD010]|nr:hypothetical protein BGX20_009985 [Mortierella sp. AD010]
MMYQQTRPQAQPAPSGSAHGQLVHLQGTMPVTSQQRPPHLQQYQQSAHSFPVHPSYTAASVAPTTTVPVTVSRQQLQQAGQAHSIQLQSFVTNPGSLPQQQHYIQQPGVNNIRPTIQPQLVSAHPGLPNASYILRTPTMAPTRLAQGTNMILPASATIVRPPITIRPQGNAVPIGPGTIISSPGLTRMPLVGNMRPVYIAAGPPSIIKNPLRTKLLLERPVPRIVVRQKINTLLSDFWGEDTDVTKDGRIINITERMKNSAQSKAKTPKQTGIVVGIDFGNTFTAVSYAHQNDGEMIDVVKWPKHLNSYSKVPSVSLYKTNEGKSLVEWGSSALASYKRSKTDRVLIRDYKLQLFDLDARGRLEHGLHLTDVFIQYIRSVHLHLMEEVNKSQVLSATSVPIHYCITIPQSWTLPTRELILRCYVEAGVILQTPAPNMTVITEAEAAATYCREHCAEFESLKDSDVFMICDAGGLTTDVTSFRVDDSLGVRQFVRLSHSQDMDCGSVMLDRRFKEFILQRLSGLDVDAKPQRQKAFETLLEGFVDIKSQFDANAIDEVKHISVPMGLDVGELSPTPSWMEDEYMSLSGQDLCNIVFDPVIDKIQNLIQKQSKVHPECAALFLVGGFGANKYLHYKLSLSAEGGPDARAGEGVIKKVLMVQKAELAVARGAVIYGLKSASRLSKAFL